MVDADPSGKRHSARVHASRVLVMILQRLIFFLVYVFLVLVVRSFVDELLWLQGVEKYLGTSIV